MLFLVTGVPGSGKTLKVVSWIEEWAKAGRQIYTNIDGLAMDVQPLPEDWQETPDNSVIIYDEAQQFFPSDGKAGASSHPQIKGLETHRHQGKDLVFVTQHPNLIHHHIRKLVGQHDHIERVFGSQAATVFTWAQAANVGDYHERQNADKTTWRFPKRLYSAYKSATVHTHKFRIPKKIVLVFSIIAAILGLVAWKASTLSFGSLQGDDHPTAGTPPPESENWSSVEPVGVQSLDGDTRDAQNEARAVRVWGEPDRLDGAQLSEHLDVVGWMDSASRTCAVMRDAGRHIMACDTDTGWRLLERDHAHVVVRSPFGETWAVPVHFSRDSQSAPGASFGDSDVAGAAGGT